MAEDPKQPVTGPTIWWMIMLFVLLLFTMLMRGGPGEKPTELPYSQFKDLLDQDKVAAVEFEGDRIHGTYHEPIQLPGGRVSTSFTSHLPPLEDPNLIDTLEKKGVTVDAREPQTGFSDWIAFLLPWILILGLWFFLWRRMMGGLPGGLNRKGLGGFLAGRTRKVEQSDAPKIRFIDVAGQENAKREVSELLDFLNELERYRRLGAEVPHGILLVGPPGTGKTLLAKALAGEAGVPFFHISASEFIEIFVGVGASRVRNLFDEAKKNAPAIIFIDELDSIGRARGTGVGGGHDEREQTLNQILAEMDGFEGHEAVVVLAATNRPDVLDPALLRPGRFDRHVTLELPDLDARLAILKVHSKNVPLANDIDLHKLAAATPGFSGADLKNLVNEAAMAAAREGSNAVEVRHFEDMRDRIVMGAVRSLAIHPDERHRLAVHESGHTAVAYYLANTDPIHKVTIIPRGRALGGTHQLPEIERHTLSQEFLHEKLAVILAGRAAERVFLDSLSSGADEDIKMATQLARFMVGRWGMSEEIGPMDVRESDEHPFLGREIALPRHFSDETATTADKAVRHILDDAGEKAEAILKSNRKRIERLITALEEKETLDRQEIATCLGPKQVVGTGTPKTPPSAKKDIPDKPPSGDRTSDHPNEGRTEE